MHDRRQKKIYRNASFIKVVNESLNTLVVTYRKRTVLHSPEKSFFLSLIHVQKLIEPS